MKGYSIHSLRYSNLPFKCGRVNLKDTFSEMQRFLCKSQLDLGSRMATDYRKTVEKPYILVVP